MSFVFVCASLLLLSTALRYDYRIANSSKPNPQPMTPPLVPDSSEGIDGRTLNDTVVRSLASVPVPLARAGKVLSAALARVLILAREAPGTLGMGVDVDGCDHHGRRAWEGEGRRRERDEGAR